MSLRFGLLILMCFVAWRAAPPIWAGTVQDGQAQWPAEKDDGPPMPQSEWYKAPVPGWARELKTVDNGVEYLVVASDPFLNSADAEMQLDERIVAELRIWIGRHFSTEAANALSLSAQRIREKWLSKHQSVVGIFQQPESPPESARTMYRSFAQLAMTEDAVSEIGKIWDQRKLELREERQRGKLARWSIIGGAMLLALAVVHSYLRLDYLTRGYHTGKLRLMLGGSFAVIAVATIWLLRVIG
jgi:hypothetical protein